MFNPCKSYALNIAAVAGLAILYNYATELFEENFALGNLLFLLLIAFLRVKPIIISFIIGLILEYTCKLFKLKFAFNFPVDKFKLFIICLIYYPLFYLGLFTIIFYILLCIFILFLVFVLQYVYV